MYIKLTNGTPTPYSIGQLRRDNPQVSFPKNIPDATLVEYSVYPLKATERPEFDPMTHRLAEGTPALLGTEWVQVWSVTPLSPDELVQNRAERTEQVRMQRQRAYEDEADPLFFQWQRGEIEQQVYLDKVEEIRARFPYME